MRSTEQFYGAILGLSEPWYVSGVDLKVEENRVAYREGTVWEVEGESIAAVYDHAQERRWRHLDTCQLRTELVARVPRVKLSDNRVVKVGVPWAEKGSRFPLMFEGWVVALLQAASSHQKVA